MPMVL